MRQFIAYLRVIWVPAVFFLHMQIAHAETERPYTLYVNHYPEQPQAHREAQLTITIEPQETWTLPQYGGFLATFQASPWVKLPRQFFTQYDWENSSSHSKTLVVPYEIEQAGEHTITTYLAFYLCNDEVCQRFVENLSQTLIAIE